MYRNGQIAKLVGVTPDTIRYYEQQKWWATMIELRAASGFMMIAIYLKRLKFIRHARELGFTLESIRDLLSIRIDPEHHTCKESNDIVMLRLSEIESRIKELKKSSNRSSNYIMHVAVHSTAVFIALFLKCLSKLMMVLNDELRIKN